MRENVRELRGKLRWYGNLNKMREGRIHFSSLDWQRMRHFPVNCCLGIGLPAVEQCPDATPEGVEERQDQQ